MLFAVLLAAAWLPKISPPEPVGEGSLVDVAPAPADPDGAGPPSTPWKPTPSKLRAFLRASPRCSGEIARCVPVILHVVVREGAPIIEPAWFAEQLKRADHHFAPDGVAFRLVAVDTLDDSWAAIETREQRDLIGRPRFFRGAVHVFVIERLDDVDVSGEQIRGVHWRDRADTRRRWVLLASYAQPDVLAHEFGHFFGLPHSRYAESIMNKRPRERPPHAKRSFVGEERAIIGTHRDAMFQDGMLVDARRDDAASE